MMKAMSRYGSVKMQRIKGKKRKQENKKGWERTRGPFSRSMIWFFPYYNTLVVVPSVI